MRLDKINNDKPYRVGSRIVCMLVHESPKKIQEIKDAILRKDILETLFEQNTMPIWSIMQRNVTTLDHAQTAYDAAMLMIKKGIECVLVTAYGKPFGMITERDIICAVVGLKISIRNLILSFLASRPLIYANPYQTIQEATNIMKKHNIRQLPIIDCDTIVGLVTIRDLAMSLYYT